MEIKLFEHSLTDEVVKGGTNSEANKQTGLDSSPTNDD